MTKKDTRPAQEKIEVMVDYIISYKKSHHGDSPSLASIMNAVHMNSKSEVVRMLNKAVEMGYITMTQNKYAPLEIGVDGYEYR